MVNRFYLVIFKVYFVVKNVIVGIIVFEFVIGEIYDGKVNLYY